MDKSSFYHSRANGRQSHSYIIFLLLTVYISSYCSLFGIFSIKQSFAWTCLRRNAFRTFCSHAQLPSPPQKKNKRGSAAAPINTRRWQGGELLVQEYTETDHCRMQIPGTAPSLRSITAPRCKISSLQNDSQTKGML